MVCARCARFEVNLQRKYRINLNIFKLRNFTISFKYIYLKTDFKSEFNSKTGTTGTEGGKCLLPQVIMSVPVLKCAGTYFLAENRLRLTVSTGSLRARFGFLCARFWRNFSKIALYFKYINYFNYFYSRACENF